MEWAWGSSSRHTTHTLVPSNVVQASKGKAQEASKILWVITGNPLCK